MVQNRPYTSFAEIYDAWQRLYGLEYALLVAPRVNQQLARYVGRPKRLIDLACGTGTHTLLQSHGQTHVLGVDLSPAMLAQARIRARDSGKLVRFVQGDMRSLDVERPVDAITCLYASLNHLLSLDDLSRTFRQVANHLRPGGVFVFDMNTQIAFETLWRNSVTEHGQGFALHRSFRSNGPYTTMQIRIERPGLSPIDDRLEARWFEPSDVTSVLSTSQLQVQELSRFNPFPSVAVSNLKELWTVTYTPIHKPIS